MARAELADQARDGLLDGLDVLGRGLDLELLQDAAVGVDDAPGDLGAAHVDAAGQSAGAHESSSGQSSSRTIFSTGSVRRPAAARRGVAAVLAGVRVRVRHDRRQHAGRGLHQRGGCHGEVGPDLGAQLADGVHGAADRAHGALGRPGREVLVDLVRRGGDLVDEVVREAARAVADLGAVLAGPPGQGAEQLGGLLGERAHLGVARPSPAGSPSCRVTPSPPRTSPAAPRPAREPRRPGVGPAPAEGSGGDDTTPPSPRARRHGERGPRRRG